MFCVPTKSQVKKNQAVIAGVQRGGLGQPQTTLRTSFPPVMISGFFAQGRLKAKNQVHNQRENESMESIALNN